ncbi:MAG: hypothetical protein ACREDL_02515 [Bradyrhizobium sp.]
MESQVIKRIERKRRDVFLRADFDDLGGYDQVGRVLGQFVRAGRLVKIGSGLYARARPSTLDGKPTPVKGLRALTEEALRRLGIGTAPTRLEQAYSEGKTTQVPSGRRVAVDRRVRRKIGYNGAIMSFERAEPAPR